MNSIVSSGGYITNPALRDPYLEKGTGKLVKQLLNSKEISQRLRNNTYDEAKIQAFESTATLTQLAFLTYVSRGIVAMTKKQMETLNSVVQNPYMPTVMIALLLGTSVEKLKSVKEDLKVFNDPVQVKNAETAVKGYLVEKFNEEPLIAQALKDLSDLRKEKLFIVEPIV